MSRWGSGTGKNPEGPRGLPAPPALWKDPGYPSPPAWILRPPSKEGGKGRTRGRLTPFMARYEIHPSLNMTSKPWVLKGKRVMAKRRPSPTWHTAWPQRGHSLASCTSSSLSTAFLICASSPGPALREPSGPMRAGAKLRCGPARNKMAARPSPLPFGGKPAGLWPRAALLRDLCGAGG